MRQFILAKGLVTSGSVDADNSANYGKVGVGYVDKATNKLTFGAAADMTKILDEGEGYIVLLRSNEQMGNVVLPFHKNHFSFVKGTYVAATAYSAEVTIPEVNPYLDYTLIVVEKGKKFNERSKWTATVRSKESDTAATIAEKLGEQFTAKLGLKVTVEVEDAKLTFTGKEAGVDFKLVPADELTDIEVTETSATAGYGSAKYITDLANKAAADAGFEYTYDEGFDFYKNYPLDPLAGSPAQDTGFTIYTLRCAEPRDVKTRDEVVHQIIQVAFPTGQDGAFEAICKKLADIRTA